MRATLFVLATLLLATTLPALAAAHLTHGTCSSTTVQPQSVLVHVDSFAGRCRGVVVSSPLVACDGGLDLHPARGVHVLVLYQDGCQTGVVVEIVRGDAPVALLP